MGLLFFGLLCAAAILFLLLRTMVGKTKYRLKHGEKLEKVIEIIKIILAAETAIFIVIFLIVIIKTLFS